MSSFINKFLKDNKVYTIKKQKETVLNINLYGLSTAIPIPNAAS